MSIKVMNMVWDQFPGSGSKLLAMLALADWSDDDGRCFPAMMTISRKMRLSRSQARRVVHSLIDNGFVEVVGNKFGGAPGDSRRYRIVFSALSGRINATGSIDTTGYTDTAKGSHRCAGRGSADATLTVNEPLVNHQTERRSLKGSRLSLDWSLPDEFRHWSIKELKWSPIKCDHVADVFRDYWIAQSGSKGIKSDWFATWRNWCRREKDIPQSKRPMPTKGFETLTYEEGYL